MRAPVREAGALKLWTGRRSTIQDPLSLNGRINGHLPNRPKRGSCFVILTRPSLWCFGADSLGYSVSWARCPHLPFLNTMSRFFPLAQFVQEGLLGPGSLPQPDLVVGDTGAFETSPWYWDRAPRVPHILSVTSLVPLRCPPTWRSYQHSFLHQQMGGATDKTDELLVIAPSSRWIPSPTFPAFPVQPWSPARACINDVTSAGVADDPGPDHEFVCSGVALWAVPTRLALCSGSRAVCF